MRKAFLFVFMALFITCVCHAQTAFYQGFRYNLKKEDKTASLASVGSEPGADVVIPSTIKVGINHGITSSKWTDSTGKWSCSDNGCTLEETIPFIESWSNDYKYEYTVRCTFHGSGAINFIITLLSEDYSSEGNNMGSNHMLNVGKLDQACTMYDYSVRYDGNAGTVSALVEVPNEGEHFVEFYFRRQVFYNKIPDLHYRAVSLALAPVEQPTDFTVTSIGKGAFSDCSSLTTVSIPETVTTIGAEAFSGCYNLNSLKLPEALMTIGAEAFSGCSNLNSLKLPETLKTIEYGAFSGCRNLKSLKLPDEIGYIGEALFKNCSSLTSMSFPNQITTIPASTFIGCSSLESVELPENLKIIDSGAFLECIGLKEITLPQSLTVLESWGMKGCSSLEKLTIPENVESIGTICFGYNDNLRELTYNARNCTKCGLQDFPILKYTPKLTTLHIGENVESIPLYAFSGCSSLTDIYIHTPAPPAALDLAFLDIDKGKCRLHVPTGSEDAYKNADGWDDFYNVTAIEGVTMDGQKRPLHVYDLTGRHVCTVMKRDELQALPKGVYIVNGQKEIVR